MPRGAKKVPFRAGAPAQVLPRKDAKPIYPDPELIPGKYPRAWPVEVYAQADGSYDFEFCFGGAWHRLPLSVLDHAATEVSVSCGADVSQFNYAKGVALLLAALEKHNWTVLPPRRAPVVDPTHDRRSQDA